MPGEELIAVCLNQRGPAVLIVERDERLAFAFALPRPVGDALEARHQALPRLELQRRRAANRVLGCFALAGLHRNGVAHWHPRVRHPRLGFLLRGGGNEAHLPVRLGRGLATLPITVAVLIVVRRSRLAGVARVASVATAAVAGTPLRPVDLEIALALAEAVGLVLRPGGGVDGLARVSLEVDAHAEADCAATYESSAPIGVGAVEDGPRFVWLAWILGGFSACPLPIRLLAPLLSGRASVDILVTEDLAAEPVLIVPRVRRFFLPLPGAEILNFSVPVQVALPAQNVPSSPVHAQPFAPAMGAQVACGS